MGEDDYDDYEACDGRYLPENMEWCDECNGDGDVNCYCAGDFCCCGAEEVTCRVCWGNGYITKERAEKRAIAHRKLMKAIWGEKSSGGDT